MYIFVIGMEDSPHKECAECLVEALRYVHPNIIVDDVISLTGVVAKYYSNPNADVISLPLILGAVDHSDHITVIPVTIGEWRSMKYRAGFKLLRPHYLSIVNLLRDDENDYRMSDDYLEMKRYTLKEDSEIDFTIDRDGMYIDTELSDSASGNTLDTILHIKMADFIIQEFLPNDDPAVNEIRHQYNALYNMAKNRIHAFVGDLKKGDSDEKKIKE